MAPLSRRAVLIAATATTAAAARAQTAPTLSVDGRLAGGRPLTLRTQDLQRLPQHLLATRSPWNRGVHAYAGPLLRDVLAAVGAEGRTIKAVALNDYQVSIPVQDARDWDVIVALEIDGHPMSVRDKGPFFIIYPFDSDIRLQSAAYFARSIWQLKSLTIQ